MNIDILYENSDVLAVNKPAGLVVHGDGKTKEFNLVDWILAKYPEVKDVGENWENDKGDVLLRSGIVHRLDRETSGVMLIAKNQKSFENLKKQFQEHKIGKTYHAFVYGEMKKDKDIIERSIGRSSQDFRKWSAQRGARGKMRDAVTEYRVLSRKKGYTFIEAKPKTGRTHQIRVHFKAINYPLVGDSLYAPKCTNDLGFQRLALHSYKIEFLDASGGSQSVTAPYPDDFSLALSLLQTS